MNPGENQIVVKLNIANSPLFAFFTLHSLFYNFYQVSYFCIWYPKKEY